MTFEEYAAQRLPALLRYAVVLTGDRHLARGHRAAGPLGTRVQ